MRALTAVLLALALSLQPTLVLAVEKTKVVTTTTDLQALVRRIGGDRTEVESLTQASQDPHAIELKPVQLARLRGAALVVRIGLDHEPWLARLQTRSPVLDVSRGVRLLHAETPRLRAERAAHVHAYGNTHFWLDPENARPMTAAIAGALASLRPADRSYFEANRSDFLRQLDARVQSWHATLAPYRGTKVVVIHDSWSYFADRFGLVIVAAAEPTPGVPPSPAELSKLLTRMRQARVRLVIADPSSPPALVRQVAEQGGARAVTLVPSVGADPAAHDYLSMLDLNVQRLRDALR